MAQQHTPATGRLEEEPNRIYWARRAIQCERDSNSLAIMASGFGNTDKAWRALMAGAAALVTEADNYIHYAAQCGGLLFCWADSRLEGGAE